MNSLSWMLYFIYLASSLSIASFTVFIVASAIVGFVVFLRTMQIDEAERPTFSFDAKRPEDAKDLRQSRYFAFKVWLWIAPISFILSVVVPNKETMVLIAASEVGDRVVNSEKVQKILDPSIELLQTYIRKQLEEYRKEKK